MRDRLFRKGLVIGIIVLFVGVGFQPAFAVESKLSTDNIEKEEDCDCKSSGPPIICAILFGRMGLLAMRIEFLENIEDELKEKYPELALLIELYAWKLVLTYAAVGALAFRLECVEIMDEVE